MTGQVGRIGRAATGPATSGGWAGSVAVKFALAPSAWQSGRSALGVGTRSALGARGLGSVVLLGHDRPVARVAILEGKVFGTGLTGYKHQMPCVPSPAGCVGPQHSAVIYRYRHAVLDQHRLVTPLIMTRPHRAAFQ
jgi:hypothetical protein